MLKADMRENRTKWAQARDERRNIVRRIHTARYERLFPGEGGIDVHAILAALPPGGAPAVRFPLVKGGVGEAVFENPELKAKVTKEVEQHLAPTAVMGTNTSTLPITGLAKASQRPANFIGIHFFSPVERMGLVEIIKGKETSEETLAKTMDYVLAIKKTPVAVNDFRGFYTSRVFGTYPEEGLTMLAEGIAPAIIENVGRMSGMPMGPLEVSDSVELKIQKAAVAATLPKGTLKAI